MNDLDKNLMKDHNYDGIQELDNDLPFWWIVLFIVTVIIGIVYCTYYFLNFGPGQEGEYVAEVKKAEQVEQEKAILALANKQHKPVEEVTLNVVLPQPTQENIANGQAIFQKNCFACHGMDGSGLVGPNLTDNFVIHGPTLADTVHIITKGVPAKGMLAWSPQLSDAQIFDVASYVFQLKGKNLKGKAP